MTNREEGNPRRTEAEIFPLLRTKLYIPPPGASIVQRGDLVQRMETGISSNHRLILVCAPAGFGKTTLISDWARITKIRVAWMSIDEGDNDLTRFLGYCIAALQTIKPDIGDAALQMQQSPLPPPAETVLTSLINELDDMEGRFALVLDDYHLLESQPIHDAMTFLIQHLPRNMHLVIATRSALPLPIARLRTLVSLTEITDLDLRFSLDETALYLNDIMQLDLAQEDITALENRTEGWIAGLQMTALSIQGKGDISGLLRALSGKQRFVLDYLMEEVLSQQPREIQDFLVKTSILNQFSASLCDAVMGWPGPDGNGSKKVASDDGEKRHRQSRETIKYLDRANLFIIPLDDERRWYRYHRLFADLLKERLIVYDEDVHNLHRRAGNWYDQNGLIGEAVHHFLEARDFDRAAEIIADNAVTFVYHGNLGTLVRWLEILPKDVKDSQPWLSIAQALALSFAGKFDPVAALLLDAEGTLLSVSDDIEVQRLSGIIDALRGYLIAIRGSMPLAADFAREALKVLPEDDLVLRGFASTLLATVLRWTGELDQANDLLLDTIAINRAAGATNILIESLCDLAALQSIQGKLQGAVATCREALAIAEEYGDEYGKKLSAQGLAAIQLGSNLRELNDLDMALHYSQEGLGLCEAWQQVESLMLAYIEHARVLQACGDGDGARLSIRKARYLASGLSPWYAARCAAWEAHLRLMQGDLPFVLAWIEDRGAVCDEEVELQDIISCATIVRTRLAQAKHLPQAESRPLLLQAAGTLEQMRETAERSGAGRYLLEILVLESLVQDGLGERDRALSTLTSALDMAEPEAARRVFIDEREPLQELLGELVNHKPPVPYANEVLQSMNAEIGPPPPRLGTAEGLPEPLSAREMEVLRLLETHLSSTEIAAQLIIAASTVRSHIKNIYSKLSVHSRAEAVEKAREIGLL